MDPRNRKETSFTYGATQEADLIVFAEVPSSTKTQALPPSIAPPMETGCAFASTDSRCFDSTFNEKTIVYEGNLYSSYEHAPFAENGIFAFANGASADNAHVSAETSNGVLSSVGAGVSAGNLATAGTVTLPFALTPANAHVPALTSADTNAQTVACTSNRAHTLTGANISTGATYLSAPTDLYALTEVYAPTEVTAALDAAASQPIDVYAGTQASASALASARGTFSVNAIFSANVNPSASSSFGAAIATNFAHTYTRAPKTTISTLLTGTHANAPTDLLAPHEVRAPFKAASIAATAQNLNSSAHAQASTGALSAATFACPATHAHISTSTFSNAIAGLYAPTEFHAPTQAQAAHDIFNSPPIIRNQFPNNVWTREYREPLVGSQQQMIATHANSYPAVQVINRDPMVTRLRSSIDRHNCPYPTITTNENVYGTVTVSSSSVPHLDTSYRHNNFLNSNSRPIYKFSPASQQFATFDPTLGYEPYFQEEFHPPNLQHSSYTRGMYAPNACGGFVGTRQSLNTQPQSDRNAQADIALLSHQISARQVITKDLPAFSGRPEDWPLFISNYDQSTERCGFTDQENLIRLQKCLRGPALEAVRGKLMVPSTVPFAIETPRMLYGRPDVIQLTLQRKLRQEPPVKSDKLETLINFALAVQNYRATVQAIGLDEYLNDPMLLRELLSKLPSDLKLDWGRRRMALGRVDIAIFDEWLFSLAICASQVTPAAQDSSYDARGESKAVRKGFRERVMVHEVSEAEKCLTPQVPSCPKCFSAHRLDECSQFLTLKRQDRWRFVQDNKLCLRCFRNHFVRRCNSKKECGVDGCRMPHNPLLHGTAAKTEISDNQQQSSTILHHAKEHKKAIFRYVPVTLFGKDKSLNTFALIDEGAACTLIESDIASDLKLEGPSKELCLRWTGDITQNEVESKCVSLDIASFESGAQRHRLRNVRTVSSLALPKQSLDVQTIDERGHLRNLPIFPYKDVRARILIGLDNAKIGIPLEIREDENDDLIATRCRIGWAVYGKKGEDNSSSQQILHVCDCSSTERMDEQMKAYFSLDAIGVKPITSKLLSKDNERAEKIMKATTRFIAKDKKWETGLLWKYDHVDLPDSFPMARRRLQCLEAKMARDPSLKDFLILKIRDYEEKGYIRKLKTHEVLTGGKSWFIPIFTVMNKNKNKTRLVWDAAAKVNETALNSVILKGPDLLKSLVGILIRFREKPVAICGDIREMFHQIRVIKEDQAAQQFLWRDGDNKKEPDVYAMTVMTFGASCSPSLANFIKNRNAERFRAKEPAAVNAIIENTFVDDWLQSVETEEEMIELALKIRNIHDEGGFEMRNWISNSKGVLHMLTGSDNQQQKLIEEPNAKYEKVLGMWWLPSSDELTFVQKFDKCVFDESTLPTKRQILRIIMTIFDPLGFLGFFVIQAKIILQNVWRSGVSWDEPIRDEERNKWWQWVQRLPLISNIRVPRCIPLVSQCHTNQLHVFVDASVNAFAAVAYLRAENNCMVCCSFVASKTRVAPLKPISIPRMELIAAILGLRLAKFIADELSVRIDRRVFWTDSKNVLYWIKSDARKYHQFVATRIGEILEDSQVTEWRWVPSAVNVADDGTKWGKNLQLSKDLRWFSGPEFLHLRESEWPEINLPDGSENSIDILHHVDSNYSPETSIDSIYPDPLRFSRWEKLCRVQSCVLKFLRLSLKRPNISIKLKNLLSLNNLEDIELVIIQKCQEEVFGEEIRCLRSESGTVSRKSVIFKYSPYIDKMGLLRVKGRIDAIEGMATNIKRPIILPRSHQVSNLIADFYHRKFHHHHNEIVVNEMRQRFCVIGLRALVRSIAKRCQVCRNRHAIPRPPEMGNLPPERLSIMTRPFTYTGVDYFGPIEIVVGRHREKRWGVLFTCLTVRAVHIETTPSLSTDSFLLVFKQFICRRGVPRRIISDNGTNFRGASRILVNEIERISMEELVQKHPDIEWLFIPPASPHMGGAWERMIRSVKSILMDILPESGLREETLRAALADVENTLNTRPLTYIPLDSVESEALTPNHFLLGSSNGVRERSSEDSSGVCLRKSFWIASQVADQFWHRWVREYLPCLTRRTKWIQQPAEPIEINDVVIIVDETSKRNTWKKGVVVDLHRASDGQARSAVVKTQGGLITRPMVKLAKLDVKVVNITQEHEVYEGGNVTA